jgi:hypothetical protein
MFHKLLLNSLKYISHISSRLPVYMIICLYMKIYLPYFSVQRGITTLIPQILSTQLNPVCRVSIVMVFIILSENKKLCRWRAVASLTDDGEAIITFLNNCIKHSKSYNNTFDIEIIYYY